MPFTKRFNICIVVPVRSSCLRSLTTSRAPSATVAMSLSIRSRLERRGELGARDSDTTCHEKKLKLMGGVSS